MRFLLLFCVLLPSCSYPTRYPTPREYYIELQGTWVSPCIDFMGQYRIQTMTFNERNLYVEEITYSDSTCSTALTANAIESRYSMGVEIPRILERGHQIFMTAKSVVMKPLSPAVAADFNANSVCGFTDWADGVYKNVSGIQCDANDKANPEVDKTYLNLLKILDGLLTFGNDRCEIDDSCITYYGQKYPREWYNWSLQKQ